MYKVVTLTCVVAVVALVLLGMRGQDVRRPDEFVFNNGPEVNSLDPHRISWKHDIRIANALFEGLMVFVIDPPAPGEDVGQVRVEPGVAERYEVSDDGRVYTFHLRPDARWSDGRAITAKDFVWSWKRVMTPLTAADYASMMFVIRGARAYFDAMNAGADVSFDQVGLAALDDHTLQVTLENPTAYFLELAAFTPFMPVDRQCLERFVRDPGAERQGGIAIYDEAWTKPENLVCNGPFVLESHWFKYRMVLRRNPQYWGRDRIALDRITALAVEDRDAAMIAYESGRCEFIDAVPGGAARALMEMPPDRRRDDFFAVMSFGTYFYRFNCMSTAAGRPNPLADPRVRRAFAMVVDKQDIVDNVTGLRQPPATSLVPPGLVVRDGEGRPHEYVPPPGLRRDVQEARRLLAEAGYADPKDLGEIVLMFNTGYGHEPIAERLRATWQRELGVTVVFSRKDGGAFGQALKRRTDKEWHLGRSTWFGDYRDPSTFLDSYVTGDGNNDCGYSNPEFDRLVRAASATADQAERMRLFRQAETILVEQDAAIVPIYFYVEMSMIRPRVRGAWSNMMGTVMLRQISLEGGQ